MARLIFQTVGLHIGTAASDYIQLYDGPTETPAASLDLIQRTAAEIIAAVHSPRKQAPRVLTRCRTPAPPPGCVPASGASGWDD